MKEIILEIAAQQCELSELASAEQSLCLAALEASKDAYAPYSSFFVGAAVLLVDGTVITGNNQENIAYPSGLCAERTALFYANAQHPKQAVKAIAIAAMHQGEQVKSITPCGACRQVILETEQRFKQPITLLFFGKDSILRLNSAKNLLPFSFDM